MTLSDEALAAADTIDKLNERYDYGPRVPWQASELRREAPYIADEERKEAEHINQIHDLAASIYEALWGESFNCTVEPERYLATARAIIECGWRKEDTE
jgi:hypothetical protein